MCFSNGYELKIRRGSIEDESYEIWQVPNPATPHLPRSTRIACLKGRNLLLVAHRVLARLSEAGLEVEKLCESANEGYTLSEELALELGLLFRALAPMRSRERMWEVAEGIDEMEREEVAYWLGMAMHRKRPRRVLKALRCLLTNSKSKQKTHKSERGS